MIAYYAKVRKNGAPVVYVKTTGACFDHQMIYIDVKRGSATPANRPFCNESECSAARQDDVRTGTGIVDRGFGGKSQV